MQKPWSLYNKEDKLRVDDLTPDQVRVVLLATASARMHHWYACQEGDLHWQPISAIPEFYEDVRQIKGPREEEDRDKDVSITQKTRHVTPDSITRKIPQPDLASAPPVQKAVQRRPLFEEAPAEPSEATLQLDLMRTKERRTARRYERRLGFQVTAADGKVFQTHTADISMAGCALEEPLPAWVPRTFTAELNNGKHSVKITCSKVSELKLKIKESASWDVIRAWIVNW